MTSRWDLKARLLELPLAALIGQVRPDVPIYGSGGFITYDDRQTIDQLTGWVFHGRIPRVKIKIGESWGGNERRDLQRVALPREVIGPEAELYVDANGGYRAGQAVRVGTSLADHGVTWFEEPVSSQDLAGLALIRGQISPDAAAGEYSWTLADSARLLDAHVASALTNLRHLEYFHDHQRIERMFFDGTPDPTGGVLTPDLTRLGLGLEFRATAAEQYRTG